jgi:hypothetical protein
MGAACIESKQPITIERGPILRTSASAGWIALAALNCLLLLAYLGTHPQFPGDFCAFYTGAHIYRQNPSHLYDLAAQRQVEQALVGRDDIPFNHPPYELIVWLPLAGFSFHAAFWIWRVASLGLLAVASWLLARTLCPRIKVTAVFIIAIAFFPVPYCLWMGQDSVLLLALFAACVWFFDQGSDFMAGLVLGLGFFKFELVLPIAAVYFLWRRWRFLAGLLCSGVAVSAVSLAMVGSSGMVQLVELVIQGQASQHMAVHPVMMPNLRGMIALVPMATPAVRTILVLILSAGLLLVGASTSSSPAPARALASLVCFAVLASFHLNLHDFTLLLLPILVVLQDRRWTTGASWTVLVPVVALFCTPIYVVAIGEFKVAALALLVGWLWYAMSDARKRQAPALEAAAA